MKNKVKSILFVSLLLCVVAAKTAAQDARPAEGLRSPDVVFVPTPHEVVDAMLKVAKAGSGDIVYDLGSGDGRIPITAVQSLVSNALLASTLIPSAYAKPRPMPKQPVPMAAYNF